MTLRLPDGLASVVDRLARRQGIRRTEYITQATAYQAGYDVAREDVSADLGDLRRWADDTDRRLDAIEARVRIRPRRT